MPIYVKRLSELTHSKKIFAVLLDKISIISTNLQAREMKTSSDNLCIGMLCRNERSVHHSLLTVHLTSLALPAINSDPNLHLQL